MAMYENAQTVVRTTGKGRKAFNVKVELNLREGSVCDSNTNHHQRITSRFASVITGCR